MCCDTYRCAPTLIWHAWRTKKFRAKAARSCKGYANALPLYLSERGSAGGARWRQFSAAVRRQRACFIRLNCSKYYKIGRIVLSTTPFLLSALAWRRILTDSHYAAPSGSSTSSMLTAKSGPTTRATLVAWQPRYFDL